MSTALTLSAGALTVSGLAMFGLFSQNTKAASSRAGTSSARHQQPDKQSNGVAPTADKHEKASSELQLIPSMDLDGVEFLTFVGDWWKPKF